MAQASEQAKERSIDRRKFLAGLSATTAMTGLAGCPGGGGDDTDTPGEGTDGEQEFGERVPTVDYDVLGGLGDTTAVLEDLAPLVQEVFEGVGMEMNINTKEFTTVFSEAYNDERTHHFRTTTRGMNPIRLEPFVLLSDHAIWSAATGAANLPQYASCEYSEALRSSSTASDTDERQESLQEAMEIMSADVPFVNIFPRVAFSAYRPDAFDSIDPGEAGASDNNVHMLINAEGEKIINGRSAQVNSMNHFGASGSSPALTWSNFPNSPLIRYDNNRELITVVADDYEWMDEFRGITFDIREDMTFHNGDDLTAEDVAWNIEFLRDNTDSIPLSDPQSYDSVEVTGEYTVEVTFTEPNPTYLTTSLIKWGILHPQTWIDAGIEDDVTGAQPETYVGSGPYELDAFRQGQALVFTPNEDHPNTPTGDLTMQIFDGPQTAFRDFQNGDLNIFSEMPPSFVDPIQNEMSDTAELVPINGYAPFALVGMMSFGPGQHRDLRMALSHGINREEANQVAMNGFSTPSEHSLVLSEPHPGHPENSEGLTRITESTSGDIDRAREILEENGWGWDDDGRLHYPPDLDGSPVWPQGDTPLDHPDEFPCADQFAQ